MSDEEPTKRKSLIHMSEEELRRGEWRKDPEIVAEFLEMRRTALGAVTAAIENMSDEDREALRERVEDGTYQYGQDLIRTEGEM